MSYNLYHQITLTNSNHLLTQQYAIDESLSPPPPPQTSKTEEKIESIERINTLERFDFRKDLTKSLL